jgi:hypothetical protein
MNETATHLYKEAHTGDNIPAKVGMDRREGIFLG